MSSTVFDVKEFTFKVLYTKDHSKEGDYTIGYKVFFTNYPSAPVLTQNASFTITIADPCKSTKLSFKYPIPYVSRTYFLYDLPFDFYQLPETFIIKETSFDCGPYKIVFFNDADNSPVDSAIFDVNDFRFKVRYTEDLSAVKDYKMRYKISFTNYPTGPILEQTALFTITIADPCKTVKLVFIGTAPYVNKTYFLHDPSFEFYKPPDNFLQKTSFLTTPFTCGPYEIVFFNNADSSPINSVIFDVNSVSFKVR